jgi:hypothetical protein
VIVLEGLDRVGWGDMWPRRIHSGGSEAWCGEAVIVACTRPFTAGEDAVLAWVTQQDAVELVGVMPLPDGRDLMLFDRSYLTQTSEEAHQEHADHLRKVLAQANVRVVFTGENAT